MHMQFLRLRYDSVFCDEEFTCLSHGSAMKMAEFMRINYSQEGKIEFEQKEKDKSMLCYREKHFISFDLCGLTIKEHFVSSFFVAS